MTRGLLILALACAGCAHQQVATTAPATTQPTIVYVDTPAAALVFDAPVTNGASVDVDRDAREPRAFIGYESGLAEFFWQFQDDRILQFDGRHGSSNGNFDRFERRAVSTRLGVLYR